MTIGGALTLHSVAARVDALENKINSIKRNLKVKSYKELRGRSAKLTTLIENLRDRAENALKKLIERTDLNERQRKRVKELMIDLDKIKAGFALP